MFSFRPLTGRTLSVTAYAVPAPPFGGAGAQRLRGFCGEKLKSGTKTLMAWQRSFCPLTGMVLMLNLMKKSAPFSPPYGDGTEFIPERIIAKRFSPPYGDGTTFTEQQGDLFSFSPPYGDGTSMRELVARTGLFSPPYGDGTGSLQCSIRKEKVFAPLRGWYQKKMYYRRYEYVFAPLRGWYTKYITEDRKMEELNA